jgi:putative intracellular protease/amidase
LIVDSIPRTFLPGMAAHYRHSIRGRTEVMDIAIVLFDGFTALDAIGPLEVLALLPDTTVTLVTETPGIVRSERSGLSLEVQTSLDDVPAPDVFLVPGGPGQAAQMSNDRLLDWIRTAHRTSTWTTSVCTGSLLLGAAGLLTGKRATSYWLAMDELSHQGAEATFERVVVDGKIMTAAGVSSGIDMALTLAARLADDLVAQTIQLNIEYDPQPPFDAGSEATAPAEAVKLLRSRSRFSVSRSR